MQAVLVVAAKDDVIPPSYNFPKRDDVYTVLVPQTFWVKKPDS
jgi:hypothetical protein